MDMLQNWNVIYVIKSGRIDQTMQFAMLQFQCHQVTGKQKFALTMVTQLMKGNVSILYGSMSDMCILTKKCSS